VGVTQLLEPVIKLGAAAIACNNIAGHPFAAACNNAGSLADIRRVDPACPMASWTARPYISLNQPSR
jgi:hypothetical protein